jgi:F0F1-type ATP synthase membrane subunit b/b'
MTEQRLKVESGPPAQMSSGGGAGAPPSDAGPSTAERAADTPQQTSAGAKEQVQEAAAPAKEKAREIAGQAKAQAQAAAGQAKDRAAAQVDQRTTQLGQQIGTQAQSLDGVAGELRRQGKDGPAKLAEQAGQRVKDVGSYLEDADGASLVSAAADAARENPAAAAAAGAAAGFVAGRLLKASREDGSAEEDEPAGPGAGGR